MDDGKWMTGNGLREADGGENSGVLVSVGVLSLLFTFGVTLKAKWKSLWK